VSRYLLISRSPEYESRLRRLLARQLGVIEGENLAFGPSAVLEKVVRRPSIALLGPVLTFEETKSLIGGLTERFPKIGIIVVRDNRADLEDWVDDMTIHAVLTPEADDATITEVMGRLDSMMRVTDGPPPALDELPEEEVAPVPVAVAAATVAAKEPAAPPAPPPPPAPEPLADAPTPPPLAEDAASRVIAMIAPKGGQGKTTLAINLAAGLAEIWPNSVVLLDADVQFGDIANALEIPLDHTLTDLVHGDVDDILLKTSLYRHAGDFFVVPAPARPEEGETVPAQRLGELLGRLSTIFRYVIVDTTPGLGEHTLAVIENATDTVLVTNMGVPSLRAVRSELDILTTLGMLPDRRVLVLNFADRTSGLTVKDVATIVGMPPDVIVPRSPAVLLASNRGEPLIHREVRDPAARAIRELIARIDPAAVPPRRSSHRKEYAS
jgi:MinD-like ATPase involved in chromosome partitioning or flagellar assembly